MRDDTLEQLVCDLSVMKNEGCFGYEENISAPKIDTYKNSSSAWAKGILMFENEREAQTAAEKLRLQVPFVTVCETVSGK